MSQEDWSNLPGMKESRDRRALESERLLSARNHYDNLPSDTIDQIDAFSDAVSNKAIETAEAEFGDGWYGGADFKRRLEISVRNFASGFDRSEDTLRNNFVDAKDKQIAAKTYVIASVYLASFPNLESLKYEPRIEALESEKLAVENDMETAAPEVSNKIIEQPEVTKNPWIPKPKNTDKDSAEKVMERVKVMNEHILDERLQYFNTLQINNNAGISEAVDRYLVYFPNSTRLRAISEVFEHATFAADFKAEADRLKRHESYKAQIIDNFSNDTMIDSVELDRVLDHLVYKYAGEMEKVGITKENIFEWILNYGKFSPNFTKEQALEHSRSTVNKEVGKKKTFFENLKDTFR